MKQPTCLQCGQNIADKRSDAKYCSDRCRMRYRRNQKSKELLANLVQLCSQIPNHLVQSEGEVTAIVIWDEKNGKHQKFDKQMLISLPDEELIRLIKCKKREIRAYQIASVTKKWLNR